MFNISGWEKKKGQAKDFLFPSFVCYFVQLLGTSKNENHTVRGPQREKTFTYGLTKQPKFRDATTGLPALSSHLGSAFDWLKICFIQLKALPRSR